MTNDNVFDATQWANAVQKAQSDLAQQWSQWNSVWAQAAGAAGGSGVAAGANPGAAGVAQQLAGQFEQYVGISRSLWELLGRTASISSGEERLSVFNEGLAGLQARFAALFTPLNANPWSGMSQGLAGMPGFPPGMAGIGGIGGMGAMGNPFGAGNPFAANNPFVMPALGPAREQQESWQRLSAAAARCAQAQTRLAAQWNEIMAAGLRELGNRMAPTLQAGTMPASLKELYDGWVNAAESAYAQAAHGAAFIQAQAEFSNALSELRLAQREILELWGRQFDLPTRAELNSLHKQVRELQAAVQRLGG
jgi:class III poly(R)-hydroxyalkanoic acid synthase PhaE subunit